MPEAGELLLETMVSDTDKFYRQLVHNDTEDNLYYETPILKHIEADNFVREFDKLSPENKRTVGYALTERYKHHIFIEKLHEEITWLQKVKSILSAKQQLLSGKVSGYIIKSIINNNIDKSINAIQQYKSRLSG